MLHIGHVDIDTAIQQCQRFGCNLMPHALPADFPVLAKDAAQAAPAEEDNARPFIAG
jgi:hypothetical protein